MGEFVIPISDYNKEDIKVEYDESTGLLTVYAVKTVSKPHVHGKKSFTYKCNIVDATDIKAKFDGDDLTITFEGEKGLSTIPKQIAVE